jgi:hypothetical protein
VAISEEQVKLIAETTIAQMEARGAFESPPGGEQPPNPNPGGEGQEQPGGEQPNPPTPPESEEPPRSRSLAERFQGRAGE